MPATIPYITHGRFQKVLDELEKAWEEWKEDPNMVFKIVNLKGTNLTPMARTAISGIYSEIQNSIKPIVISNFKVNDEEVPMFLSVLESESYVSGGQNKIAYKLQCSMGILFIFDSDEVVWVTKYVPCSAVATIGSQLHNDFYNTSGENNQTLVQLKLDWDTTKLDASSRHLLTALDITVVYQDTDASGNFTQYTTQARTVTSDSIYTVTYDEPKVTFTADKLHLFAGNAATI